MVAQLRKKGDDTLIPPRFVHNEKSPARDSNPLPPAWETRTLTTRQRGVNKVRSIQ